MLLLNCWQRIYGSGEVLVDAFDAGAPAPDPSDKDLAAAITEIDAQWREELAGVAPPLVVPIAIWATRIIYRACQFLAYREFGSDVIHEQLCMPAPSSASPEGCYSADLALRVLPELLKLARATSPEDPLVEELVQLSKRWPLSSVGEPLPGADVSAFVDHPTLRTLYVDRIIATGDVSRLDDPRIADAVRAALGGYPEIAPIIAEALRGKND